MLRNLIKTNLKNYSSIVFQRVDSFLFIRKKFRSLKSQSVYLIDEEDPLNDKSIGVNKYTNRSYTCGELTINNVGESVILCGWLEYQRMNKFAVLRDAYGETQLFIKETDIENQQLIEKVPLESIIKVKGTVLSRPINMRNEKQKTGDIEVVIENLSILNKAKNLPFNIREYQKAKESLRMQYRYLDLRFHFMQRNLRIRSDILMKMREFLINIAKFVEVETPTLFRKTTGGAQEFVVPTRYPGEFYSLVQSPQQFKQMLMAGSIDRYFQIARCYRDEGGRSDRQPEFTQLDIEMSFTNVEGIMNLIEDLLQYSWPDFLDKLPENFPKLSYKKALELYGTDQPDISFDYIIQNCSDSLLDDSQGPFSSYLIFSGNSMKLNKSIKEKISEINKQYKGTKVYQLKIENSDELLDKTTKIFGINIAKNLTKQIHIEKSSIIFLATGDQKQTLKLLGRIRLEYVNFLENLGQSIRKKGFHPLWIIDFPLFEQESGELLSGHHPFTAPHPDDLKLLESDPLKIRALSYDLVLNGNEIGGGSIRIHNPELQQKILRLLKLNEINFQHIIDMLSSGCPPHGGIALGLDRLLAKILNTTSIRDVIAFPKTFEGRDLLSGAPTRISDEDQKIYHINVKEKDF